MFKMLFSLILYLTLCQIISTVKQNEFNNLEVEVMSNSDPDAYLTPGAFIKKYGYHFEEHHVETTDGFVITMYRMYNAGCHNQNCSMQPVFLHHGIFCSSMVFLWTKEISLGFWLANHGYDVWLTNARATEFSSLNRKYKWFSHEYWDFSFHEMGHEDVPLQMEKIAEKTNNRKAIFIGHSMGTTVSYVYATRRKKHAERHLKGIISLAPVAFMEYGTGFLRFGPATTFLSIVRIFLALIGCQLEVVDFLFVNILTILNWLNKEIGLPLFFIHMLKNLLLDFEHLNFYGIEILHIINGFLCMDTPVCRLFLWMKDYIQNGEFMMKDINIISRNFPEMTSVKTLEHYERIILSQGFFDFEGKPYNLSTISLPVYLFYGNADTVADPKDVTKLYDHLVHSVSKNKTEIAPKFGFNHADFVVAKDIAKLLYNSLMPIVKNLTIYDK